MESKTKYVKYLRVSTKKQGSSGLGLGAQSDIIDYFARDGEIVATFSEVYTGTDLKGCAELRKAIAVCKSEKAKLIIYKSDRFRNVDDALSVMAELGEGNLICCDIPSADRFTFILFFAIAEREALLISLRTNQALQKIRDNIAQDGYHVSRAGNAITSLGGQKGRDTERACAASAKAKADRITADPERKRQWLLINDLRARGDTFDRIAATMNATGEKTPEGKPWSFAACAYVVRDWGKYFN